MKKFFIVLSILILCMTNIVLAKSFSDVANTNYVESVEQLTELNVINGYNDNTFKPNKEIKRSEMAKMLIVALGKESSVKTTVTQKTFPDVPMDHWAVGYIELASELNLIKGYPNGNFAPDDKVSYVEAVTMMLRALNYNKEMENLSWPDGYMQKASDIKLTKNVSYNNANDDAIRGEVSNMLWNTMNAHTREIKSTSTTGVVEYKNGKKLIEKSFPDKYVYINDSVISDVDLEKETITVKVDGKDKKIAYDTTETELKKLFGRTVVSAIYDENKKEFILFELNSSEKVVTGTVSDVIDDYIYIGSKGYKVPAEDKVKLVGLSKIEYAEKVFIIMDGTEVKAMLIEGEDEEVYIGVVTDDNVTVNKQAGIKVATLDGDKKYALDDEDEKIYDGDVIIYSLNSDNELVLKKAIDIDDSLAISTLSSSAIKLSGEDKVTLSDLNEYKIVMIEDEKYIEEVTLSEADKNYDTAAVIESNGTTFIVIFYDGLYEIDPDDTEEDDDSELYVGVVLDNNVTVNKKSGIKVETVNGDKKYALEDADESIYDEDVIIYTLNSDNELVVKEIFDIDDSLEISSLSSSAIKLYGKSKIYLSSLDDYNIFMIEDFSKVTEAKLDDADEDYDTAIIEEVNGTTFIVIFYDGLEEIDPEEEEEEDTATMTKSQAKSALKSAITKAKGKKETSYTIASWAKLETALADAEKINQNTATAAKMQTAAENLNAAVKALKLATSSDKNLRSKYNELQALIDEVEALDKDDYTTESYATLNTYLANAKKIVLKSTTLSKVEAAITNINSAKKSLVTNTTAENMIEAKARLEDAIEAAKALNKDDYTTESYEDLEKALKAAEDIDYAKDGSAQINNVARNIEEAIIALVTKEEENKQKAIDNLKANINKAKALTEATYTTESWADLEEVLDDLEAYNNVYTGLTVNQINTLNSRLETALDDLVKKIDVAAKENLAKDLNSRIQTAKAYTEQTWAEVGSIVTWSGLQEKIAAAEAVYKDRANKTIDQIKAAYDALGACWGQ